MRQRGSGARGRAAPDGGNKPLGRLVVKYGGASIDTPARMREAASFLASDASGAAGEVVAVCSAASGITDELIAVSARIRRGDRAGAAKAASRIVARSRRLARESVRGAAERRRLLDGLQRDFSDLHELVDGMSLLGEVTPRSMDYLLSFGERLSARTMAHAVRDAGAAAVHLAGNEAGIVTDSNFGSARLLMDTTRLRVSKALGPLLDAGTMPVVGGFVGADQHGSVTTLGRGGSDYTATTVGACIGAGEIWLMSEVDGLLTADPSIVPGARVLPTVSYMEAMEMAMFGAKQIHPRTFEPLLGSGIPMRVRSSSTGGSGGGRGRGRRPAAATAAQPGGTLVVADPAAAAAAVANGGPVKCISTLRGSALIDVRGDELAGEPGTAARIFSTLAGAGANVTMISQNPSESSISMVVSRRDMDGAVAALERDMLGGMIKKVEVTPGVAVVALIGSGMRGAVGVASQVFGSIAREGINVVMITQGSSELNLAFVVRDADCESAVRVLHGEFGLAGARGG